MKKIFSVVFILVLVVSLAACAAPATPAAAEKPAEAAAPAEKKGAVIAECITKTGNIDDRSFCQGAYEGIKKYAAEFNKTYAYYQATGDSTTDLVNCIGTAVDGGAEIVVTPGFAWGAAIYAAQDKYPQTKLVILDGEPHTEDYKTYRQEKNVFSIYYAEEESGFLAGYAAVKNGSRKLGFLGGMAVPPVVRFGYGFVWGADVAAQELGLQKGDVTMNYHYLGNFNVSPENQTYAASWYSTGIDTIFAAAGDVTSVVSKAANQVDPKYWVIGVDVNQGWDATNILTSATKNLRGSTYQALDLYFSGKFPGGEKAILSAKEDGVNIPTEKETWRFTNFTTADYEAILAKLKDDTDGIASKIPMDTDYKTADLIPTVLVKVTVM